MVLSCRAFGQKVCVRDGIAFAIEKVKYRLRPADRIASAFVDSDRWSKSEIGLAVEATRQYDAGIDIHL